MKSNYKLVINPLSGLKDVKGNVLPIVLEFYGSIWQANKAFEGLRITLDGDRYKSIELFVVSKKSETGYKINAVNFRSGKHGL